MYDQVCKEGGSTSWGGHPHISFNVKKKTGTAFRYTEMRGGVTFTASMTGYEH